MTFFLHPVRMKVSLDFRQKPGRFQDGLFCSHCRSGRNCPGRGNRFVDRVLEKVKRDGIFQGFVRRSLSPGKFGAQNARGAADRRGSFGS